LQQFNEALPCLDLTDTFKVDAKLGDLATIQAMDNAIEAMQVERDQARQERNNMALYKACSNGNEKKVLRLLRDGASMLFLPNGIQGLNGHRVPFAYELGNKSTQWKKMFAEEEARRERAGRRSQYPNGGTLLHTACYFEDINLIQELFMAGVSLDIRDKYNHLASDMGDMNILKQDHPVRMKAMFNIERDRRQHRTTPIVNQFDAARRGNVSVQLEQQLHPAPNTTAYDTSTTTTTIRSRANV
jgi:hypothetical protein